MLSIILMAIGIGIHQSYSELGGIVICFASGAIAGYVGLVADKVNRKSLTF